MTRTRTRIVLVVLFLVAVAIAAASVAGLASAGSDNSMTAVAKQATARFHNLDAAKAAGWNVEVVDVNGLSCIDNQPVGGMGVHYANPKLLGDAKLDPAQPEALVYAPNPAGQTGSLLSSTSCSRMRGPRPDTVILRRCSASRSSSRRRRTGSVCRRSGHFTSGSGSRTRPGSSSRGTRACTAEGNAWWGRCFRPHHAFPTGGQAAT